MGIDDDRRDAESSRPGSGWQFCGRRRAGPISSARVCRHQALCLLQQLAAGAQDRPGFGPVKAAAADQVLQSRPASAPARVGKVRITGKQAGVIWLTRASVHWAARMAATSSCQGWSKVQRAIGIRILRAQQPDCFGRHFAPVHDQSRCTPADRPQSWYCVVRPAVRSGS